jgi:SecD/SecF fusion protein
MAIIVDGRFTPPLSSGQKAARSEISGSGRLHQQEAITLATLLNNPLENPMKILSESSVSSAYGQSSIESGQVGGHRRPG